MAENLDSYNAALARSIHSAIQRSTPLNKNYQDRIKRFTKFVDSHPRRDEFLLPPNKYCSKQSIETFLLENERGRKCNRSTAEKTILAINKLVILEENAELGPDIRTNGVTNMAVSAYLNWIENEDLERKKARLSDPLEDNPIKFAAPYDLSKVSTTRLQERGTNWADVAVVWAVASWTGLRFENVSKLSLDKLYLAENLMPHGWYVPPDGKVWGEQNNQRNTDTRLLTFLIPPVDQIK